MQIPVYDTIHQTKVIVTTKGTLEYTRGGIMTNNKKVSLSFVTPHEYGGQFPVNHALLSDNELLPILNEFKDARGWYVSSRAANVAEQRGL